MEWGGRPPHTPPFRSGLGLEIGTNCVVKPHHHKTQRFFRSHRAGRTKCGPLCYMGRIVNGIGAKWTLLLICYHHFFHTQAEVRTEDFPHHHFFLPTTTTFYQFGQVFGLNSGNRLKEKTIAKYLSR